ncbi:MAG: hypothetical protein ACXITV_02270 [Luteibaculaceae bacterium]
MESIKIKLSLSCKLLLTCVGFWLSSALSFPVSACDVCGAGSFQNKSGLLNTFGGNFIGLRHSYRSFNSTHPQLFPNVPPIVSEEFFNSTELLFRYMPHKKVQLIGSLPYNNQIKFENGVREQVSAIGDISLAFNYNLFEKKGEKFNQMLFAGAMAKAPTGYYEHFSNQHGIIIPNMQPGTGSWDFGFTTQYIISTKKWGVNNEATLVLNGHNTLDYDFGNKLAFSSGVFRNLAHKEHNFFIHAGLRYDFMQQDLLIRSENILNEFSGGYFLDASLSAEWYFKNWAFTLNYLLPVSNDFALDLVVPVTRISAGLIYFLPQLKKDNLPSAKSPLFEN